jgi:hypothetical protein
VRIIKLSSAPIEEDWSMQFMDDTHYTLLLAKENVQVFKPDGSPLCTVIRNAIPKDILEPAHAVLKKYNVKTDNRSTAAGIKSAKRKRVDGSLGGSGMRVPRGWEVVSGIMGNFERTVRMPYCHHCSFNQHNPDKFAQIIPTLVCCTKLFQHYIPDRYAVQMGYVNRTHPDFVIPNTAYTTITVNKNFRTACHKDAGDLAAGFSNMLVLSDGEWTGANLVLPRWKVGVELRHNDFIMFDAHEWHGNTQQIKVSNNASRVSVVMYYREKMVHCGSVKDELNYVKNRKLGDPLFPGEK